MGEIAPVLVTSPPDTGAGAGEAADAGAAAAAAAAMAADSEQIKAEAGYLESALQTFVDYMADPFYLQQSIETVIVGLLRLVKELRKEVYLAQEQLVRSGGKAPAAAPAAGEGEGEGEGGSRELGLVEAYLENQHILQQGGPGTPEGLLARPRMSHYARLLAALRLFASVAPEQPHAGSPYALVRSRRGSAEREASGAALVASVQSAVIRLVDLVAPDGSLAGGPPPRAQGPLEAAVDAEADLHRLQRTLIDLARKCQRSPVKSALSPGTPRTPHTPRTPRTPGSAASPARSPRPPSSGGYLAPPSGAEHQWPPPLPPAFPGGTLAAPHPPSDPRAKSAPSSPRGAPQRRHSLEPFILSPRPPEGGRSPRASGAGSRRASAASVPASDAKVPDPEKPAGPPRELSEAEKAFIERMWGDAQARPPPPAAPAAREKKLADAREKREKEAAARAPKEVDVAAFVQRMEGDAKARDAKLKQVPRPRPASARLRSALPGWGSRPPDPDPVSAMPGCSALLCSALAALLRLGAPDPDPDPTPPPTPPPTPTPTPDPAARLGSARLRGRRRSLNGSTPSASPPPHPLLAGDLIPSPKSYLGSASLRFAGVLCSALAALLRLGQHEDAEQKIGGALI
eukprot:tig00020510_g9898.t1